MYLLKREKWKGKQSLLDNQLCVNKEAFPGSNLLNNTMGRKYYYCHLFFLFIGFLRERERERKGRDERERKREINLFCHLFMHSLIDSHACSGALSGD